jgi:hypothetical protein
VRDEAVDLHERALVDEQVDALARRQLALPVLGLDTRGAAAGDGGFAHAVQALDGRLLVGHGSAVSGWQLDELGEHAVGRLRVHEGDARRVRAAARRGIDRQ